MHTRFFSKKLTRLLIKNKKKIFLAATTSTVTYFSLPKFLKNDSNIMDKNISINSNHSPTFMEFGNVK